MAKANLISETIIKEKMPETDAFGCKNLVDISSIDVLLGDCDIA